MRGSITKSGEAMAPGRRSFMLAGAVATAELGSEACAFPSLAAEPISPHSRHCRRGADRDRPPLQ